MKWQRSFPCPSCNHLPWTDKGYIHMSMAYLPVIGTLDAPRNILSVNEHLIRYVLKFFVAIKMKIQFISFLNTDMAWLVEIIPCGRQEPVYHTVTDDGMVTRWRHHTETVSA